MLIYVLIVKKSLMSLYFFMRSIEKKYNLFILLIYLYYKKKILITSIHCTENNKSREQTSIFAFLSNFINYYYNKANNCT